MKNERFFGIHYDFHATPEGSRGIKIGENLTEELIAHLCDTVQPDFLQIDCKGHPGYSSYPTKVGTAATEFGQDPLKLWRKVTPEKGVALLMHYSGIWDGCYLKSHPDQAAKVEGAGWEGRFVSLFGNYEDELMIPQLKELALEYGVDGVWVDGDCWAVFVDTDQKALDAFYQETGIRLTAEEVTGDNPHFETYREFLREAFRKYVKKYTDAVHEVAPNFRVASNWAFSEQMPEKVTLPVDFLSGDFSPNDSVNGVICGARILAAQDYPWDLMAGGFRRDEARGVHAQKTAIQLMQEAATIISLGGGFQVYLKQKPDGNPQEETISIAAAVSEFCRKRRDYCFQTKNVPNAVLFNSTADHYASLPSNAVFGRYGTYDSLGGWSKLLMHAGHSYEVREEHNLFDRIDTFKMVVCPEIGTTYSEETVQKLLDYAQRGGFLVLSGCKTLELFRGKLPIVFTAQEIAKNADITADRKFFTSVGGERKALAVEGEAFAWSAPVTRSSAVDFPIASILSYGKGKIALISMDIGQTYNVAANVTLRKIGERLLEEYTPTVKISGSKQINLNVTEDETRLLVHLVNIQGDHDALNCENFDEIPPIGRLTVEVQCPQEPKAVRIQPDGREAAWYWINGKLKVELDGVELYDIIEILR